MLVVTLGFASCDRGFWTAGQRADVTRLTPFVWKLRTSNGNQEVQLDYANWYTAEPNNYLGSSNNIREACLQVWKSGLWNDNVCTSKLCYVCEYDL